MKLSEREKIPPPGRRKVFTKLHSLSLSFFHQSSLIALKKAMRRIIKHPGHAGYGHR